MGAVGGKGFEAQPQLLAKKVQLLPCDAEAFKTFKNTY